MIKQLTMKTFLLRQCLKFAPGFGNSNNFSVLPLFPAPRVPKAFAQSICNING